MISVFTYLFALLAVPSAADLNSQGITEDPKELEWVKTTHDFGEIVQGTKAKHTFTFINKGTVPVMITNASASCGCTVPNYSKEPVAPGAQGSVTAIFDSSGKSGNFAKNITVTTNVGSTILYIKGNITVEQVKPKSPVQIGGD
jgi:hypothetical protein